MGFFKDLVTNATKKQISKSVVDYNDPKAYVERKFISSDVENQKQDNIFKGSKIPIVTDSDYIYRNIRTSKMRNPDKSIFKYVEETWFYEISHDKQIEFLKIVENLLNGSIKKNRISGKYIIPINKISFKRTSMEYPPDSCILYIPEDHMFYYMFSGPDYMSGKIFVDENGIFKKAEYKIFSTDNQIKETFKSYKTGFDIYKITLNKNIIYKREK